MRIGFDAKRAFNNQTGLGNYSRFIINALLKYAPEQEYELYTPKPPNPQRGNLFENEDLLKVKTPPLGVGGLWRSWLIVNDLIRDNVDIYHGLRNEIPFRIKQSGIKSVVTIHDLIFLRYPELYPAIDRFFYKKKFRYACQNADAIVAVSQQTKDDIMEFYKIPSERIRVIYQDCQEIFFPSTGTPAASLRERAGEGLLRKYSLQKPYIICVSSFSERKNQKRLIEAFQSLHLKDYELVLIGGKTKYAEEILNSISPPLGVGSGAGGIKLLFNVPSADLPALYQGASLCVYPSFFEGFGIPIVEALHSGIPVVAATGSCLEEAGGEGALYANPLNVNDLADKINQVLSNESLQKEMVLKGQTHIKQFSAECIAKQLIDLYKEI
jgi:glycosyltransferase involved in cell wall biosynthesis